jgi:hypothetical protein
VARLYSWGHNQRSNRAVLHKRPNRCISPLAVQYPWFVYNQFRRLGGRNRSRMGFETT